MGSEIQSTHFSRDDYRAFGQRLKQETELLKRWLQEGRLSDAPPHMGLELETWLIDRQGRPAPINAEVLQRLDGAAAGPELAQYNLELNTTPLPLSGRPFTGVTRELTRLWDRVNAACTELDAAPGMIGILPSLLEGDLHTGRMSALQRYRALNDQVLQLRNRRPIHVDIEGAERVHLDHQDVMLEAAATSLQLHLQTPPRLAARLFNASLAVSAATVALAANSPFLFGRRLWEETRIPLFEQAVEVGPVHEGHAGHLARVTFGSGYARDALYNFFVENRQHYPILLPVCLGEPPERLPHLALQNGTIWRWNRPLVGFGADGRCHLRIEHRVMAAGPTIADMMANAAFYYGVVYGLLQRESPVEAELPFEIVERNFYAAARWGLEAPVRWCGGTEKPLAELVLGELLPTAFVGLRACGVEAAEAEHYLGIIEKRASSRCTGAAWQAAWVKRHGRDMCALVQDYWRHQQTGAPVHTWSV